MLTQFSKKGVIFFIKWKTQENFFRLIQIDIMGIRPEVVSLSHHNDSYIFSKANLTKLPRGHIKKVFFPPHSYICKPLPKAHTSGLSN